MSLEFTIEFYETVGRHCPVQDFLDILKATDPGDFASVLAGLAKLRNPQYHREPLSKALGKGLYELRHVGKLNTRVLWFFMQRRRIVVVHGIRNKGRTISSRDLETAQDRMRDWRSRMGI
ncbi:type II toxin-antitoxin system RelE/ParE family toxin [Nitrospira sp. BLG_2]|uniref:type II toxin-antitoxin system RelE/ParE family toxin n=1 Tax=Nitrospira sp. BLG_2 TaxID=3397507 RepID=UPI003B99D700